MSIIHKLWNSISIGIPFRGVEDLKYVNCISFNGKGCSMKDAEGSCPVHLNKTTSCSHQEPVHRPMNRPQIIQKLEEIEAEKAYKARCLKAGICPECGADLRIIYDDNHDMDDGICDPCSKTYIV